MQMTTSTKALKFGFFPIATLKITQLLAMVTLQRDFCSSTLVRCPPTRSPMSAIRVTRQRSLRLLSSISGGSSSSSIKNPNRLYQISRLQNDFCVLRHGQSLANVAKIISSHPEIATIEHGLSETGRKQAQAAAERVVEYYRQHNYDGIIILASDFLRAKETAEIVRDHCLMEELPLFRNDVIIETRLRERWFGEWDGQSDAHYNDVWKDDAIDPSHTIKNVESVNAVMDRTTDCILEWDAKAHHTSNKNLILLVAHGDVLQITQTAFAKVDGSLHRTACQHLETATLRPLILADKAAADG